jgi:sporadic carbohydrate cluster protein (TIGR04323 family)
VINLVTYSMSRPFYGINIPIPIQSAYLRDYASRNGLSFSLPVTEVCFGQSYYALGNIFRSLEGGMHFGAVSILVLPLQTAEVFKEIMNLVSDRAITFHFPLEGFCGNSQSICDWRDDFLVLRGLRGSVKNISDFLV